MERGIDGVGQSMVAISNRETVSSPMAGHKGLRRPKTGHVTIDV